MPRRIRTRRKCVRIKIRRTAKRQTARAQGVGMIGTKTAWLTGTLVLTVGMLSGCATRMSVQQYVLAKIPRDNPGFVAALEAANAGQAAFNLNADTPILEIREGTDTYQRLGDLLTKSRDAYRKASSYRMEGMSSTLQPVKDKVRLTDVEAPRSERVAVPGMDIGFRVQANRERIDILYIESARGLPVLRFDSSMNLTVTRDFYPYLMGDKVDVGGDIRQKIRRTPEEGR